MTSGFSPAAGGMLAANEPKAGFALALLANTLQVGAVFIEASDELRTFLFLVSLLGSVALVLWVGYRWPTSRAPIWIFVTGTLLTIGLFIWVSKPRAEVPPRAESNPPGYYIRLSVYAFDSTDGALDTDQQLTEIPIVIRDQYKHSVVYKTRRNGASAVLQTYGPILVGACGFYHARVLEKDNDSEAKALVVRIGIDLARLSACKE